MCIVIFYYRVNSSWELIFPKFSHTIVFQLCPSSPVTSPTLNLGSSSSAYLSNKLSLISA